MIEKAFIKRASKSYYLWLLFLLALIGMGGYYYMMQLSQGLAITGMNRDVTWGLYIAQFTFLVGVAASAVMVVLPYYLHNVKEFGKITVVGEFLAIASVIMCLLFIIVDMGMPQRLFNMILYPTLHSPMFWDMVVLNGYLLINVVVGWTVLESEWKKVSPPKWVKYLAYASIPFAVAIHTVTAFLYSGIPGRDFWLSASIAPKFLVGAFATGPALLILICFALKRLTGFDAGKEAIRKLSLIVTYAFTITIFMLLMDIFVAFFSQVPSKMYALTYMYFGLDGYNFLVPFMWVFVALSVLALVLLINPKTRSNDTMLMIACASVFIAMFIEKGLAFVPAGLVINPFGGVTEYIPSWPEVAISIGIWAVGLFILSILYKIVVTVKEEQV